MNNIFRVLSLGGGVQSSAMIYMVEDGLIEKPDLVIFSDTGSEKPETIELIKNQLEPLLNKLGIEFRMARSHLGRLDEYYKSKSAIPMIGFRHCTAKFKIRPIRRVIREYVGNGKGKQLAEAWLGITTDEDQRAGKSEVKWIQNRFPLLEIGWSRQDCLDYLETKKVKVVKSGCFMCPYSSGAEWVNIKENYPDLWNRSLELEAAYFENRPHRTKGLRYDKLKLTDSLTKFGASKCDNGGCFI